MKFWIGPLSIVVLSILANCVEAQESEAWIGQPLGVGKVTVQWDQPIDGEVDLWISSPQEGRLYYPAPSPVRITVPGPMRLDPAPKDLEFGRGRILERLGQVVKAAATADSHQQTTGHVVWFLFKGDAPFELHIAGPIIKTVDVIPQRKPKDQWQQAKNGWWRALEDTVRSRCQQRDVLPVVDAYLLSSLSRRMQLPSSSILDSLRREPGLPTVVGLMESRGIRRRVLGDLLLPASTETTPKVQVRLDPIESRDRLRVVADTDLPEGVEELASFVPPECFYLRFGSFRNMLWFQKLTKEYGGDITNLIRMPSDQRQSGKRLEELLNVRYTKLADLFGDQLISDVAVIGTDMLLSEGPSLGIVLRATNGFLLSTLLETDRRATANAQPDCSLTQRTVQGVKVSVLSTPDNRIRSFYIKNGDWLLVTCSERLAERCIESRKTRRTLAASRVFQDFRRKYQIDASREPPITLLVHEPCLNGLMSSRRQAELYRRNRSFVEMSILTVARQAAKHEGASDLGIDALVASGFLSTDFSERAEQWERYKDGHSYDLRRGRRGSYLPIIDTQQEPLTDHQLRWELQVARELETDPSQTQPIFLQLHRTDESTPDADHVSFQLEFDSGLLGQHRWLTGELAEPTDLEATFPTQDLISFSANIRSKRFSQTVAPHFLFGGIRDSTPVDFRHFENAFERLFAVSSLHGFLAAWPDPGVIDSLPLGLGRGSVVGPGMTRLVGGAYRYRSNQVSVLSFHREVLESTISQIAIRDESAKVAAKVVVNDLRETQLLQWLNRTLLGRAEERSRLGASFLNQLTLQLGVAPEEVLPLVKEIYGFDLACPLGGTFRRDRDGRWSSTASPHDPLAKAPLVHWFRGLRVDVDVELDRVLLRGDLTIGRSHTAEANEKTHRPSAGEPDPQQRRTSI